MKESFKGFADDQKKQLANDLRVLEVCHGHSTVFVSFSLHCFCLPPLSTPPSPSHPLTPPSLYVCVRQCVRASLLDLHHVFLGQYRR